MRSIWHPAPDALAGVLAGIWSVDASRAAALSARVLPDGTTCLVFQRDGTTLRSREDGWRRWDGACVSGPRTGPLDIEVGAAGRILIVQLLPAGAMPALDAPMSSLADRSEPLDAVVGTIPRQVTDCVLSDASALSCVEVIERWLLDRVHAGPAPCEVTHHVIEEVALRTGSVRVDDLAGHVRLSRRHLGRIMRERVGFAPKLFARITRFHHAVQLGRARPAIPLARIAFDGGYADQAHMTREFAALGGIRPSDLRGAMAATIW